MKVREINSSYFLYCIMFFEQMTHFFHITWSILCQSRLSMLTKVSESHEMLMTTSLCSQEHNSSFASC
jgi:hypothetical protein